MSLSKKKKQYVNDDRHIYGWLVYFFVISFSLSTSANDEKQMKNGA